MEATGVAYNSYGVPLPFAQKIRAYQSPKLHASLCRKNPFNLVGCCGEAWLLPAKADESAGGGAASATSPRQGPAAAEEASGMQT